MKVFAGKAVIAKQRTLDNTVIWHHADPVTGSRQTVSKSGEAAITPKARQEYEPLGQAVRTSAPLNEPGGGQIAPLTNDALFPEWQCALPLADLPRHCSQAAEQAVWNEIYTSWEKKEGNVSGIGTSVQTAGDRAANLTATVKPTGGSSAAGSPVDPASIPNDGGVNFEQDEENGNVSFGAGAGVAVEVRNTDLTVSGYVGADVMKSNLQTIVSVPTDLRGKVVERLDNDNKKCRNFLDKVRANLKIKETFEELFDKVIADKGKFVLDYSLLGTGKAGVSRTNGNQRNVGLRPSTDATSYINAVLHELIHRANEDLSHNNFAKSAYDALSNNEQQANPLPTKADVKAINKAIKEANKQAKKVNKKAKMQPETDLDNLSSGYFSRLVNDYCKQ